MFLPHGYEPYSDWEVGQKVIVWGRPVGDGHWYRGPAQPNSIRKVARLTKTQVILEDDSRWKRESGEPAVRADGLGGAIPAITPATDELVAKVKRLHMVVRVKRLAEKADFTKLSVAELNQIAAYLSKCQPEARR